MWVEQNMTPKLNKLYIDPRAPDTRIKSPYFVFRKNRIEPVFFIDIDFVFLFILHHVARDHPSI